MRILLFTLLFNLFLIPCFSQIEKTQYNFAQSYIGFSSQIIPGKGTSQYLADPNNPNSLTTIPLPYTYQPRIDLGGLHYWGHLDMMASIPIFNNYRHMPSNIDFHISTGFSMHIRCYPISLLKPSKFGIRPFFGTKWSDMRFWQRVSGQSRGTTWNRQIIMLESGIGFERKKYILDLTGQYLLNRKFSYPVSRSQLGQLNFPTFAFCASIKYLFDITKVNDKPEVKEEVKNFESFLKKNKKANSFGFAIGVSELLPATRSSYKQRDDKLFLQNPGPMTIFPEVAFTYYISKYDLELGFVYRQIRLKQEGYGVLHETKRNSLSFHLFKFLYNHKGFAPFVGAGYGYSQMKLNESDHISGASFSSSQAKYSPMFFIGWDIRPTNVEWMTIRSSMRYNPWLYMNIGDTKLQFSDIEINFLQYVVYIDRIIQKKKFIKQSD